MPFRNCPSIDVKKATRYVAGIIAVLCGIAFCLYFTLVNAPIDYSMKFLLFSGTMLGLTCLFTGYGVYSKVWLDSNYIALKEKYGD
jgi:TM2 domain-containing membrane protein YozV